MITPANGRILVACIGNIFLGDDGFGVEMARELRSIVLPPEVTVIDYGIRGFDLAYALLEPWSAVILVDAIARGGSPGDLYLLEAEQNAAEAAPVEPHSMNPFHVFALAHSLGVVTAPVYLLGCEPAILNEDFDGGMGLSPSVSAALPKARFMIEKLIKDLISLPAAELTSAFTTLKQEEA